MVDKVNVETLFEGARLQIVHLTNESDGTGETDVRKVDISELKDGNGQVATYSTVLLIEYSVADFNYVVLEWDHGTDDEIAVLKGQGVIDWYAVGGKTDPGTADGTGDIVLTTDGGTDGAMYDITIHMRAKA